MNFGTGYPVLATELVNARDVSGMARKCAARCYSYSSLSSGDYCKTGASITSELSASSWAVRLYESTANGSRSWSLGSTSDRLFVSPPKTTRARVPLRLAFTTRRSGSK